MNKYPLSTGQIRELANDIVESDRQFREIHERQGHLLSIALKYLTTNEGFQKEAEALFNSYNENIVVTPKVTVEEVQALVGLDDESETTTDQLGTPMSQAELSAYFNESPTTEEAREKKDVNSMSLDEIEEWEKNQNNSNDIYKLAARVKNLARVDGKASLTPVGEALCNTYTHVLKAFYDFADTITDQETKKNLYELIRNNENMPGNLISAGHGTKGKR